MSKLQLTIALFKPDISHNEKAVSVRKISSTILEKFLLLKTIKLLDIKCNCIHNKRILIKNTPQG